MLRVKTSRHAGYLLVVSLESRAQNFVSLIIHSPSNGYYTWFNTPTEISVTKKLLLKAGLRIVGTHLFIRLKSFATSFDLNKTSDIT